MILEELDESNNTYLSAEPVIQDENGMWVVDENKAPYPLNSSMFPVMADFDTWVGQWNLQPVGSENGEGFPIFDLNASQVDALTWGGVSTAGHYAVVDMNETFADLEPVIQDGNGTWMVTAADNDFYNLVPSIYYNLDDLKAWLDANASAPVAFLPFDDNHTDGNHSGPGDYNGTNPGDHNGTFEYAVYDFNSTHLFELTGSASAFPGTYVILEELDESNNTYLSAEPVIQDENGMWVVDENKAPYPLNSSMFPVMADFDTWVGQWNLQPVGDQNGEGFPIFDLNASQVDALTWGGVSTAGHYAVVDMNETFADLEPVIQDGNGTWMVTAADNDFYNLVPSIYYNLDDLKAWLDANASAPVAFLPFDDNHTDGNHSGPGDYNGTNPGDHNGTFEYAVYDFNSTHLFELTGSESAFPGTYVILEELDENNNTYLSAEPVIQDENGMWVVDENKAPYPLNSSMFPVMADFDTWVGQWNLQPVGDQSWRRISNL